MCVCVDENASGCVWVWVSSTARTHTCKAVKLKPFAFVYDEHASAALVSESGL